MNVDEDESETSSIEIPEPMYNGGIMRRSSIKMVNKYWDEGEVNGKGFNKNYLQRALRILNNRCSIYGFRM
jgi:hypothetical protein